MNNMNPVVHFEMPYEDGKRVADFYSKVFGWQPKMFGADMGNYITVMTMESDEKGHPKRSGVINGGFFKKTEDTGKCPSVVISVENIEAAMKKVSESGGTVLGKPMEIPQVGSYVSFLDTEGNRASLLQPIKM